MNSLIEKKKPYTHQFCRESAVVCTDKNSWIITGLVKFQAQERGKGLWLQVTLQHQKSQYIWEMKVNFIYA